MFIPIKAKVRTGRDGPFLPVNKSLADKIKPGWCHSMPVIIRINGDQACWKTEMLPESSGHFKISLDSRIIETFGSEISAEVKFNKDGRRGRQHGLNLLRSALVKNNTARTTWMTLCYREKKNILTSVFSFKSKKAQEGSIKKLILSLSVVEQN